MKGGVESQVKTLGRLLIVLEESREYSSNLMNDVNIYPVGLGNNTTS